jgi:hypothetical protein
MTQAYNLSQLANNLDSSGRLDATDGLVNAVPVANGGTGASSAPAARTNLGVAGADGSGASGDWNINSSGIQTSNWTVLEVSGQLLFQYQGVTKFVMDQATGFTSV